MKSSNQPLRDSSGRFTTSGASSTPRKPSVVKTKVSPNASLGSVVNQALGSTAPVPRQMTHVYLVFDESGSMYDKKQKAIEAMNAQIQAIRLKSTDQDMTVSLIKFGDEADVVFAHKPIANVQLVSIYDYNPNQSSTALRDGVCQAAKLMASRPDADDPNVAFLIITVTDGYENSSKTTVEAFKRLAADTQATGKCTYVFQMAPGTGAQFARTYGVFSDNIREWDGTAAGLEQVRRQNVESIGTYFDSRRTGVTSSETFYKMTTDLSKVTKSKVQAKLTDISANFKVYTVDKECDVKTFAEEKTKKEFIFGSVYYELTKREEIQKTKKVAIQRIGETAIYGGSEARSILGLPDDGTAKVTPGRHGDWKVFAQSTSINRKLVRGSKVLIDKTQTTSLTPTWDHTAVQK